MRTSCEQRAGFESIQAAIGFFSGAIGNEHLLSRKARLLVSEESPTRHSLAHGINTLREVDEKDAIQMLLILQGLPYWLEHVKEIGLD